MITTKSPRFPEGKTTPFYSYSPGIADRVKSSPNTGVAMRCTSPRLPKERTLSPSNCRLPQPLVHASIPATASFKMSSPRFPSPRPTSPDVQVGSGSRAPNNTPATMKMTSERFPSPKPSPLCYKGLDDWTKSGQPCGATAGFRSRSPRLPASEYRGASSSYSTADPRLVVPSPSRAVFRATSPRFEP